MGRVVLVSRLRGPRAGWIGTAMNPLALAKALIRCPSITPVDDGAQQVLSRALAPLGFAVERPRFGAVDNLVAVRAGKGPPLAFAGHTDVVPPGDAARWRVDPFAGEVVGEALVARGAVDMKGAIAAFAAAAARYIEGGGDGALLFIITGDEEGEAVDGTARLMPWLAERALLPVAALVGEPTSESRVGDTIKIGRRGSLNGWLTVEGRQGHVAYPTRADNPIGALVRVLARLEAEPLDSGTEWFEPSNFEVTRVEGGEPVANNLIPAQARARFNIRFNDLHSAASLEAWLRAAADAEGARATWDLRCSGEAFRTEPGPLSAALVGAVEAVTGATPAFSTGGGTSDARFIRVYCPVVELGLVGKTMHQVDEAVPVADLHTLTHIYAAFLERWFADA